MWVSDTIRLQLEVLVPQSITSRTSRKIRWGKERKNSVISAMEREYQINNFTRGLRDSVVAN